LDYRLAFCTRAGKRQKTVEQAAHVLQTKSLIGKDGPANGTPVAVLETLVVAQAAVLQNDLEPLSVH